MSRIITCPHCATRLRVSEGITDKTLICPHCFADVDNARTGSPIRAADINTDVKRALSVGSIILAVLIGLCALGIEIVLLDARRRTYEHRTFILATFFFAVLAALVSIAIILGLVRWGISGVQAPSAGRVLGILFLSLGTIVAVIIFSFFTCLFLGGGLRL